MIKFFRKIRQNLLLEGKIWKYLRYAAGEIMLVVVGILLALYIDNLNEKRQAEDRIKILLEDVLNDLDWEIENTSYQLIFYKEKQKIFQLILGNELTYEDYANNSYPALTRSTNWYAVFAKERVAYDNLTRELNSIPEKYKSVMHDLSLLYNSNKTDTYGELVETLSNENIKKQADNFEWYSLNVPDHQNKEMINYMLYDYRYKNEVKHYSLITGYYRQYLASDLLKEYRIRNEIAKLLGKPKEGINPVGLFDAKTLNMMVGQWESEQFPGLLSTVFVEDNLLKYKSNQNSEIGHLFSISKNVFIDIETANFYDIIKEGDEYIHKDAVHGTIWKKVKK